MLQKKIEINTSIKKILAKNRKKVFSDHTKIDIKV